MIIIVFKINNYTIFRQGFKRSSVSEGNKSNGSPPKRVKTDESTTTTGVDQWKRC